GISRTTLYRKIREYKLS
ncbi:MAG: helix-turn-helix domain-containing protein, partial [Candidatus Poribacteria bacterium]